MDDKTIWFDAAPVETRGVEKANTSVADGWGDKIAEQKTLFPFIFRH